jgi:hypothetical protein
MMASIMKAPVIKRRASRVNSVGLVPSLPSQLLRAVETVMVVF